MTTPTAWSASRTVSRVGYGASQPERLHERRREAVALLRRALPAGVVCVRNAYSLASRDDEDMLELCAAEGVARVPFFPLGDAFPGLPKVTGAPALRAPGTADAAHLEADDPGSYRETALHPASQDGS